MLLASFRPSVRRDWDGNLALLVPDGFISVEQPMEIYVDDETKLTLHGLQQYYIKLAETEKNRKLNDLLDLLDFNQVCCFAELIGSCAFLHGLCIPLSNNIFLYNFCWLNF